MKSIGQAIASSSDLSELRELVKNPEAFAAKKRAERIAEHGFSEDCECDVCGDTGREPKRGYFCSCDKGRAMSQHKERYGKWKEVCPDRFLECRIESHPDRDAASRVRQWLETGFKERRNLILSGPVGTGKSGLAVGAMYGVHMRGISTKFETFSMILDQLRPKDDGDIPAKRENLSSLIRVGLLVVDDLGTHKSTEWSDAQLFDLINGRTSRQNPFIITTNWTWNEMKENLDDRLVSRLAESTDIVPVLGRDLRRTGRAA